MEGLEDMELELLQLDSFGAVNTKGTLLMQVISSVRFVVFCIFLNVPSLGVSLEALEIALPFVYQFGATLPPGEN